VTLAVVVAIVSASIAAFSLGYTVWDRVRSKPRRRLTLQTVYNTSVVTMGHAKNIRVHYGTDTLQNPRIIGIEIVNTGNTELKKDDISYQPTIEIADGKIISSELGLITKGSQITARLTADATGDTRIKLPASALNPGDRIKCELLVDGGSEDPSVLIQASGFEVHRVTPAIVTDQGRSGVDLFAVGGTLMVGTTVVIAVLVAIVAWGGR
jgi:hypothetical protein